MDFQKSFSYQFEDTEWISKLGMGALIAMVPVLNFAWTGYMVGVTRNVLDEAARPLPEWDELGKKWTDGLILAAARFLYALPMFLFIGTPITFLVFAGILSGDQNLEGIARALAGVGSLLFVGMLCFAAFYGLALSVIFPAILLLYAREGTFASCFQFRRILDLISRNSGPYFMMWGVSLLAGIAVSIMMSLATGMVGWVPCIGWAAAILVPIGSVVYLTTLQAHLVGQFGRLTSETPPSQIIEDSPAAVE